LPLRSTRDLGDYSESTLLPHRLGDLSQSSFSLIRLTSTEWFAADHPMVVTEAFVDGQQTAGWDYAVKSDNKGHSWTVVNFAAPVPAASVATARGRGKLDAVTGALIENPGDIFAYIATLAGRPERWNAFRAESAGIRLAVNLADDATIHAYLDRIAQSTGAIWTPDMARLYPTDEPQGPITSLSRFEVSQLQVSASITDTCDILRLAYDVEEATQRPLRHMEFSATPQLVNGAVLEITLPLIRHPTDAESIGRRVMIRLAGRRYTVNATIARTDRRPGDWIQLTDCPSWPLDTDDPVLMILAINASQNAKTTQITAEYVESNPSVSITAHSVALPDVRSGSLDIEFRNGIATVRATDVDGRPIKDARVSLDGGIPHRTDFDGQASFIATRGAHSLLIEAAGFADEALQIEL
jgi:hypothetical protein